MLPEGVKVLSITELTRCIQGVLECGFSSVWVVGEISGHRPHNSGHVYFTLKEAGAQLPAVIYRSTAARLRLDLKDGLEVVTRGRLSVYPPHGKYQFIIEELYPKGLGAREEALRRLKEKLAQLGYFKPERKRPLPRFPRRVALVTSPAGAAVRDMLETLARRSHMSARTFARRFRADPLGFMCAVGRDYGDLASFWMGPLRVSLVNSPPLIREVLVTKHKSFCRSQTFIGPLRKIDGNGLVLSEGDFWLRQRRLVQPAFATKRFDGYAQVTVEYTRRMLDGWHERASLDVADAMTELTLQIIAKTLFDVELEGQATQFGEAVRVISAAVVAETGFPVHLPDWLPLAGKRRKRWALRTLDEFVWSVIRQRRASGDDRGDLLSMLLMAVDEEGDGGGMTDLQARDEAITLFNAGHDTTASALAWIWYLLGGHPAVEDKLIREVDGALAGRGRGVRGLGHLLGGLVGVVIVQALRSREPADDGNGDATGTHRKGDDTRDPAVDRAGGRH